MWGIEFGQRVGSPFRGLDHMPPELESDFPSPWPIADYSGSDISGALRDLAGNLMRVSRGSGRAHQIAQQITTCAVVLQRYAQKNGQSPSPGEFEDMLRVYRSAPSDAGMVDGYAERELVIAGALQVAASRILDQPAQEGAGLDQMRSGVRNSL